MTRPDPAGFLRTEKCRIYDRRFSICHIYPHLLRRNADATGQVMWRQLAHPGEHGSFYQSLSNEECLETAQKIKEYENAYFTQQISFFKNHLQIFYLV